MKNLIILVLFLFTATAGFAQAKKSPGPAPTKAYANSIFRSADGTFFDLERDPSAIGVNSYINILDWLQGRVAGLQIYTLRNGTKVPVIRNSLATVYVDDMRYDPAFLNLLPVQDIAAIKVMKTPGIYMGSGGAIAVYTKRGEAEEEEEIY